MILKGKWLIVIGRICAKYKKPKRYPLALAVTENNFYIKFCITIFIMEEVPAFVTRGHTYQCIDGRWDLLIICDIQYRIALYRTSKDGGQWIIIGVVEDNLYFYVGSTFTFVSRHRHGCYNTCLVVLRVFLVLICFCHRVSDPPVTCQLEHNDGCNDSYASVCCRTVKHIFGVSGIDMFLRNGIIHNAVSK
jgi:hypothetical protein